MKKVKGVILTLFVLFVVIGVVSCTANLSKKEANTVLSKEDYKLLRGVDEALMCGRDRISKNAEDNYAYYTRLKEYDTSIMTKYDSLNKVSVVKVKEEYQTKTFQTHSALKTLYNMLEEPSKYSEVKAEEAMTTIIDNSNWAESDYNKILNK